MKTYEIKVAATVLKTYRIDATDDSELEEIKRFWSEGETGKKIINLELIDAKDTDSQTLSVEETTE